MTYYGLSMTSVSLADDMYLGFFLSALAELPVVFVLCFLIERYTILFYLDYFAFYNSVLEF